MLGRVAFSIVGLGSLACGTAGLAHAGSAKPVEYRLAIAAPTTQYVAVEMTLRDPRGRATEVAIPAWTPGSYKIRDFSRNVYDVRAHTPQGEPLPLERIDKQTWSVVHRGRDFTVSYRVFAAERSVRTSYVGSDHASVNGASVFMYSPDQRSRPCTLALELPDGWRSYTALTPSSADAASKFRARDYDELVDSPLQLGTPSHRDFTIAGTRFEYVFEGGDAVALDLDRLVADAQKVTGALGRAMGGFPMARYVFLVSVTERGGGGLEHDDSTMIMLSRGMFDKDDAYERAASVTAHEFFHLWNVRRIRDAALRPYDYRHEVPTRLLWFHEGFTVTVARLTALRAGIVSPKQFLEKLGEGWTAYLGKAGRNHDPIADLSFEAWIKEYQPAANHRNVAISYYEKGAYIGLALDLELRLRSAKHGATGTLFGVFRRLMHDFGRTERGMTYADIVAASSAEAGEDMAWFFERYVRGVDEIDLGPLLEAIGVKVVATPVWKAGKLSSAERAEKRVYTGLRVNADGAITNIDPGSPASGAALMLDDEIVAVEGRRFTRALFARIAGQRGPGKRLALHVFRDGELLQTTLGLAENPQRIITLELQPEAEITPATLALRERWLARDPEPSVGRVSPGDVEGEGA